MSRKRLAIFTSVPILIVVLAVGLTRSTNDGIDPQPTPTSELPNDLSTGLPYLQPVDETLRVEAGSDCSQTTSDPSPSCQAYELDEQEVAWLVEQAGEELPVASFLHRVSPTEWRRVLRAGGTNLDRPFDSVNVRIDDLTADGLVETVFGFHHENDLAVDVVDRSGTVLLHLDLPDGQILVGDGELTTYVREGDGWRRDQITTVDGRLDVRLSEVIDGPPEGNL